jgi:hypothetical protein
MHVVRWRVNLPPPPPPRRPPIASPPSDYIAGEIVMSYFLLLFYAYALIGPWPIHDLRVYYVFFAVWCSIMFLM